MKWPMHFISQPKPKRAKQSQVRASQRNSKSKGDDSLVLEEEEEKTTVVAR